MPQALRSDLSTDASSANVVQVLALDQYPTLSWKEKLAYLITRFLDQPQIECPVTHHFEDGKYIREMVIPKGTLFIGRPHRYGHECILVSGKVIHCLETGRKCVDAPFRMHTQPGDQVVIFTKTDIVGRTVHPNPTGTTDTDSLEADIFESLDSLKAVGLHAARILENP